jgi:DNA processing protein
LPANFCRQQVLETVVTKQNNWLIAIRAPGLGGTRLIGLVEELGGIEAVVSAPSRDLKRAGLEDATVNALTNYRADLLETDTEWLESPSHHLLPWDSDHYPALLRNIPSPPAALFVDGNPDTLWQPQIAVIGSRNPTAGGRDNALDFASELSRQGLTITSGMASGIDSFAHGAALDAGGYTVAVTGTGLDIVYPASGRELAARIPLQGALVSEFPLGTPVKRSHFPSRNRIISGLSLGVLVVEAGLNSGTLITARMAGNQGRNVFALPGSIHNPMSKGCHRLIREGVRLVENITQIMEELAPMAGQLAGELEKQLEQTEQGALEIGKQEPQLEQDPDYRMLWSCMGFDPKPVDSIIQQSGLTARAVSAMLLMLELRGKVEAHPGGAYSRK